MFLILGGTGRARRLAGALEEAGIETVTSLAGRTVAPLEVAGATRVGGFGGARGLLDWLQEHRPRAVIDATHPDAAQISANAVDACRRAGIELCRYQPPSWRELPEAADWTWVRTHAEAADHALAHDGPVLLTVGRQPLSHYLVLRGRHVVARLVDDPDIEVPPSWEILRRRGPFSLENERDLLAGPPPFGVLVSKDAGGDEPAPKLVAAGELGVDVVMLSRPIIPDADLELADEPAVVGWARARA